MEKPTVSRRNFFCRRLLILLLCFACASDAFALLSGRIRQSDLAGISVVQEDEYCFAGEACAFVLKVPYIPPSLIQTTVQSLPDGVTFLSSVKDEYYEDGTRSTIIRMQFVFSEVGVYKMPSLAARVDTFSYNFPFETVTVNENPATVRPFLSVSLTDKTGEQLFDKSNQLIDKANKVSKESDKVLHVVTGKPVLVTVYCTYAARVSNISWTIPEDSVFTEISRFQVEPATTTTKTLSTTQETSSSSRAFTASYSLEKQQVISFEWTPLKDGEYKLPQLSLSTLSYSGIEIPLECPVINVISSTSSQNLPRGDTKQGNSKTLIVYPEAFSNPVVEKVAIMEDEKVQALVHQIATLRRAERNSFLFSEVRQQRLEAESILLLKETEEEPKRFVTVSLWVLLIATLILVIILFILKKKRLGYLFLVVSLVVLFFLAWNLYCSFIVYGIFSGGDIRTVPEMSSSAAFIATSGTRVRLLSRTSGWMCVSLNDGKSGWVEEQYIELIN